MGVMATPMRAFLPQLALLTLTLSGCGALECQHSGRFWDGCNWCFCRDREVLGCTNMACAGRDAFLLDRNKPTIGPPPRPGLFAYRPGRGREVDPSGWPCQLGSSWMEQGGCVRCFCSNKMIKCRDSGLCLNGELLTNDLPFAQEELVRRRRGAEEEERLEAPAAPEAAQGVTHPADSTAASADSAALSSEPTTTGSVAETTECASSTSTANLTSSPSAPAAHPESVNTTQTTAPVPAPTPAQNTVVKERSCSSGNTWEEDCNSCWCLDKNRAACTANSCEQPPGPLPLGAPSASSTARPAAVSAATAATAAIPTAAPTPAHNFAASAASGSRRKRKVVLVAT